MINFQSNILVHDTAIPKYLLRIKQDLSYESFDGGIKYSFVSLHANKIFRIATWSQITEALRSFKQCGSFAQNRYPLTTYQSN